MISKELLNKQIWYPCGYDETLDDMIYDFKCGSDEFTYKGHQYRVREEYNPKQNMRWMPAIGPNNHCDESWQFFDTFEDLVENYKFPDGKTMLDFVFTDPNDLK